MSHTHGAVSNLWCVVGDGGLRNEGQGVAGGGQVALASLGVARLDAEHKKTSH